MGDTTKNGDNGFLRILIAEENEIGAFVTHRELNKLAYPCSVQRISRIEEFREKIPQFSPRIILVGEAYSNRQFISDIRKMGITLPVICIARDGEVKSPKELLDAGATDVLWFSQVSQLAKCVEGHLTGTPSVPFCAKATPFRSRGFFSEQRERLSDASKKGWAASRNTMARCEKRLLKLDEQIACAAGKLWNISKTQWAQFQNRRKNRMESKANASRPETIFPPTREEKIERTNWSTLANRTAGKVTTIWNHAGDRWKHRASSNGKAREREDSSGGETDTKETCQAIELSFKTLFHTSLDGILLLDNSGMILHANSAASSLLGCKTADLLGNRIFDFVPFEAKTAAQADWDMLLTLASHEGDFTMENARSQNLAVHFRGRTNLWFGVHLLILKDMTALRHAYREPGWRVMLNPS